jgi:hypothetical protein
MLMAPSNHFAGAIIYLYYIISMKAWGHDGINH